MSPGGARTEVQVALEAEGATVLFAGRSFLIDKHRTFACFYETGIVGEAPRRRYTSIILRSNRPFPIQELVIMDYDPK